MQTAKKITILAVTAVSTSFLLLYAYAFTLSIAPYRRSETINSVFSAGDLGDITTWDIFVQDLRDLVNLTPVYSYEDIHAALVEAKITIYQVKADPNELKRLDRELPSSGKEYIPIQISTNDNWLDAKLKYRGDFNNHWAYSKKSYLIKLENEQKINLVNPKSQAFIADRLAHLIAVSQFDLLSPQTEWAGLFLNSQFKGVYMSVEDLNDTFAQTHRLQSISSGENLSFDYSSGLGLFEDHTKWQTDAGISDPAAFSALLQALHDRDPSALSGQMDLDYWARFYAWVALVYSRHYDTTHNWKLARQNNRYLPITWDPQAFRLQDPDPNRVEEVISPFSQTLRQSAEFNQLFTRYLWQAITDPALTEMVSRQTLQDAQVLAQILDYDTDKGSADNPQFPRSRQTTDAIIGQIGVLKAVIFERIDFLREQLSSAHVGVYSDPQTLITYILYQGLAPAQLNPTGNQAGFTLSSVRNQVSPQLTPDDLYAHLCPTAYDVTAYTAAGFSLTHTLTGQVITPIQLDSLPADSCPAPAGADISEDSGSLPQTASTPAMTITTTHKRVSELIDFAQSVNALDVLFQIDGQHISGTITKAPFQDFLQLHLNAPWQEFDTYRLYPFPLHTDTQLRARQLASTAGLPYFPARIHAISLNGFTLKQALILPDISDSTLTQLKLSPASAYQALTLDTLNSTAWQSGSQANHMISKNQALDRLLTVAGPESLGSILDLPQVTKVLDFLKSTGNAAPEYVLYLNPQSDLFDIILVSFDLYPQPTNQFKDPLLNRLDTLVNQ